MALQSARALYLVRGGVIAFCVCFVALMFAVAPFRFVLPPLLALAAFLWVVVSSNARRTEYGCSHCSARFKVPAWIDFLSPHLPERKLLRCPDCGAVDWHPVHNPLML